MEYPQVDYGVINHEADCWDAHSQFLAWVRIRDPMLPKVSNRYCNFECFASSEIWHILHQRLYWQRFKHTWILGTTNSFSQYNSISEFGTRLFPFFSHSNCAIFRTDAFGVVRGRNGRAQHFSNPGAGKRLWVFCWLPSEWYSWAQIQFSKIFSTGWFLRFPKGSWVEVVKIFNITHKKRWFSQQTSMIYRGLCIPSAKV